MIGGIFILLGALIMSVFAFGSMNMMGMDVMAGTMSNMYQGMSMGMMMGFASSLAIVGLASGTMVVLGAVMLYTRPFESQIWGAVILTFSVVSIIGGMGGFIVGLILGLVGGIFALTWRPLSVEKQH